MTRFSRTAAFLLTCTAAFAFALPAAAAQRSRPPAPARAVSGAPGKGALSNADRAKLDRLLSDHRGTRLRLAPLSRRDLDRLDARVRDALFPADKATLVAMPWERARALLRETLPNLSEQDSAALAAYAIDGVAAGDLEILVYAETKPDFETLQAFQPRYLQIAGEMSDVNRSYDAVTAILKANGNLIRKAVAPAR